MPALSDSRICDLSSCAIKLCTYSRERVLELFSGLSAAGSNCIRVIRNGYRPSQSSELNA